MNALLVSFFAEVDERKYYGPKAEALKEACREFSVKCVIEELPSQGYMKNCLRKPQYILDQFDSTDRSVLWVDADGCILNDPAMLEQFPCDVVAMAGRSWPVLASPLLFHRTERARIFLQEWARLCNQALLSGEVNLDHDILCRELVMNDWYRRRGISLVALPSTQLAHIFKIANSSSPEKRQVMSFIEKRI
jgi:hypothetical protein